MPVTLRTSRILWIVYPPPWPGQQPSFATPLRPHARVRKHGLRIPASIQPASCRPAAAPATDSNRRWAALLWPPKLFAAATAARTRSQLRRQPADPATPAATTPTHQQPAFHLFSQRLVAANRALPSIQPTYTPPKLVCSQRKTLIFRLCHGIRSELSTAGPLLPSP